MSYFFNEEKAEFKIGRIVGWIVGAILVMLALPNTLVATQSGTVGIITRLGKVTREVQPGVHLKVPFIDAVTGMNVQVQKEQVDAEAATNDLQDVTSTVALNYHLDHGRVADIFINLSTDYKERIIAPVIQETVKSATAKFNAAELLTRRPEVTAEIKDQLSGKLEGRGIVVDQFSIVNFKFSKDFTNAIEQKQVAQQNAEKAQFNLKQAQLDAQSQEVQKASLSQELLLKYAIDKWDGKMPTYLGGGSVFNIPLSK